MMDKWFRCWPKRMCFLSLYGPSPLV